MKTIDQITDKDFYYCYNLRLFNFLDKKGIRYVLKAKSVKDNKTFTAFLKTEKLQEALDEYTLLHKD